MTARSAKLIFDSRIVAAGTATNVGGGIILTTVTATRTHGMPKYKEIITAKIPTKDLTKKEREATLNKFFKEAKKCMKHNADNNGRETFIVLITASKVQETT